MSTLDLLKNIVNVEQSSEKVFLVHMPILYSNGDWALIEVTENPGGTFNLNDCGTAILNAYSVVNQFDKLNVKKYLSQIINDFDVQIMHSGEIYLNNIPKEQIYSRMIEISAASQKFSEILINATMKQNEKKLYNLVEDRLKELFKSQYKYKVKQNYEIVGNSSKQYQISFCINDTCKRLIQPTANNTNSIAKTHMMFYDIGSSDTRSREIIIDGFEKWETPNIELLKPICECITPYSNLMIS